LKVLNWKLKWRETPFPAHTSRLYAMTF
jgi:hypothetical protein